MYPKITQFAGCAAALTEACMYVDISASKGLLNTAFKFVHLEKITVNIKFSMHKFKKSVDKAASVCYIRQAPCRERTEMCETGGTKTAPCKLNNVTKE